MAEEEKKMGMTDNIFSKIAGYLGERISIFVAFLFSLLGIGMVIGGFVVVKFPEIAAFLIAAPFVLAVIAYYNRVFAIIAFIAFLVLFIL